MTDLAELDRRELEETLAALGAPRFHGRQIYRWLYKRGVTDPSAMTDLSQKLRDTLAAATSVTTPTVAKKQVSEDGTTKFLLQLADGKMIEAVYIPDTPAQTFCISTQVGCAMSCGFCLTGKMGLVRNLTAGEISGQVRVLASTTGLLDRAFNIVLMGMGEPLHNYDNVMKAIRILHDPEGMNMSMGRITLSTAGMLPALERLAEEPMIPNLAISLTGATNEKRDVLMPINRKYPIEQLLDTVRRFPLKHRQRVTFEYVLLKGVTDSPEDARALVRLLRGIPAKVNLIPFNEADELEYKRPSDETVERFQNVLVEHNVSAFVRKNRGNDISAACGQLMKKWA